jgi:hypothetical protein
MMQDLVGRKNDFKHDRGPQTPYEYSEATHGLNQKLRECLRELAFLVQHPMRLVQDFDIDWKTRQTVLSTLVYVGDPLCANIGETPPQDKFVKGGEVRINEPGDTDRVHG